MCSPMSTASAIRFQFDKALAYHKQQTKGRVITTLLLDEVGLAEQSPDMPLKVMGTGPLSFCVI